MYNEDPTGIYNTNSSKDPELPLSCVWIGGAPELEIWPVFEAIEYRIVLVGSKVHTVRFLEGPLLGRPRRQHQVPTYRLEHVQHAQWDIKIADVFPLEALEIG